MGYIDHISRVMGYINHISRVMGIYYFCEYNKFTNHCESKTTGQNVRLNYLTHCPIINKSDFYRDQTVKINFNNQMSECVIVA
jgi:hypothetical protein